VPFLLVDHANADVLTLIGVDATRVFYGRFNTTTNIYAAPNDSLTDAGNAVTSAIIANIVDAGVRIPNSPIYGPAVLGDKIYGRLQQDDFSVELNGTDVRNFGPPIGGNLLAASPFVYAVNDTAVFQYFSDGGLTANGPQMGKAVSDLAQTPDASWFFWIDRAGGGDAGVDGAAPKNALLRRMSASWHDPKTVYEFPVPSNDQGSPSLLAASNHYVFFVEGGTGDLLRLPVDVGVTVGGASVAATRVWKANGRTISQVVAHQGRVYLTTAVANTIYLRDVRYISECGGQDTVLVGESYGLNGLTANGPNLYWADSTGIRRTPF
jgi:hypothetical protein